MANAKRLLAAQLERAATGWPRSGAAGKKKGPRKRDGEQNDDVGKKRGRKRMLFDILREAGAGGPKVVRAAVGAVALPDPHDFVLELIRRAQRGEPISSIDQNMLLNMAVAYPADANVLNAVAQLVGQLNSHNITPEQFASDLGQYLQFIGPAPDGPPPPPDEGEIVPPDEETPPPDEPPTPTTPPGVVEALNTILHWVGDGTMPGGTSVSILQAIGVLNAAGNYGGLLTAIQHWQAGQLPREDVLAFINDQIANLPETQHNNIQALLNEALAMFNAEGFLTVGMLAKLSDAGMPSFKALTSSAFDNQPIDWNLVRDFLYDRLNDPEFNAGEREQTIWDSYLKNTFQRTALETLQPTGSAIYDVADFLRGLTQRDINHYSPTQQGTLDELVTTSGGAPEDVRDQVQTQFLGFNPVSQGETARFGGLFG